jgi:hypothetical protein
MICHSIICFQSFLWLFLNQSFVKRECGIIMIFSDLSELRKGNWRWCLNRKYVSSITALK